MSSLFFSSPRFFLLPSFFILLTSFISLLSLFHSLNLFISLYISISTPLTPFFVPTLNSFPPIHVPFSIHSTFSLFLPLSGHTSMYLPPDCGLSTASTAGWNISSTLPATHAGAWNAFVCRESVFLPRPPLPATPTHSSLSSLRILISPAIQHATLQTA